MKRLLIGFALAMTIIGSTCWARPRHANVSECIECGEKYMTGCPHTCSHTADQDVDTPDESAGTKESSEE